MKGHSQIEKLLKSLERQGCRVRRAKRTETALVFPPQGPPISIHMTPSDWRTVMNTRALVLRAGLDWPKGVK